MTKENVPDKKNQMNALPDSRTIPFTDSDLPLNEKGEVYHIELAQHELAPNILIVGDPGRAEMISQEFLRDITTRKSHRGLSTFTGIAELTDEKVTIATSGMGTPSLEIVLGELVALNEIDLKARMPKKDYPRLQIVRVGTCGGLQESTKLGTPIITSYSIGMDNSGFYYDVPYPDETCGRLEKELDRLINDSIDKGSRFHGRVLPYVSRPEPMLVKALSETAKEMGVETKVGLTVSCSGFFAAQGRNIARNRPTIPDLDAILSKYDPGLDGQMIENMEMETSLMTHYMGGLGYWSGSICTAIANRRLDTFISDYQDAIKNSIGIALKAMAVLRKQYPDA